MNLPELVAEVQRATHLGEEEIVQMVRSAWPAHREFTPTQAALVVNSIQRNAHQAMQPRTLSDEQIWGRR